MILATRIQTKSDAILFTSVFIAAILFFVIYSCLGARKSNKPFHLLNLTKDSREKDREWARTHSDLKTLAAAKQVDDRARKPGVIASVFGLLMTLALIGAMRNQGLRYEILLVIGLIFGLAMAAPGIYSMVLYWKAASIRRAGRRP